MFVVLAALAVHTTRGFEDVLRVEATERSGLEDLFHGVLGDHHPLGRVWYWQRFIERAIEDPDYPPPRTRA